jgi:iron complex transport system ATP-binding protein
MDFELAGACFSHGPKRIFTNLSLGFAPGMFHAVLGPNGCGKTTLLDILCGHRKLQQGSLRAQGRDIGAWRRKELAKAISLVPQDYQVHFPYTAREVVAMGRYPHLPRFSPPAARDEAKIEEALSVCRLEDFAERLVTELSGGEKQRVAFARALAQDAPAMLLDEPCSSLDVRHSLLVLGIAAKRVREQGGTVVAVLHDVNLAARFADTLVFLKEGSVVASGPTRETLREDILETVFDTKARVAEEPALGVPQVVFL